jgi:hypothetical protein
MVLHELWHAEPVGGFSGELRGFRMVVQALNETSGEVRFLVLRQSAAPILIGSGIKEGWRAAMAAAEQMVDRCSSSDLPADRKSS